MLRYFGFNKNSVWCAETERTPENQCIKKWSHRKYIDQNELKIKDIPSDLKDVGSSLLECINNMSLLTCRIENGSAIGTGFVHTVRRSRASKCLIKDCDDHSELVLITVATVTSVVSTNTTSYDVSLHYPDCQSCMKLCSVRSPDKDVDKNASNWCEAVFGTHDLSCFARFDECIGHFQKSQENLYNDCKNKPKLDSVVIVGYPHGGKLKVSFGKLRGREKVTVSRGDQFWCEYLYDALTCAGSSGSPLLIPGQPLAGYGYWFGHPHCHTVYNDRLKSGRSSIGCEITTKQVKYEEKNSQSSKSRLTLAIVSFLAITTYVYFNL